MRLGRGTDSHFIGLCLLVVAVAPLYLFNLGAPVLWQDEGTTALLARQVLRHGLPFQGEGAESASQNGLETRAAWGLDVHAPWLQAYIAAAALALAPQRGTAASAADVAAITARVRLPFALFGLLAGFAVFFFVRDALAGEEPLRGNWPSTVGLGAAALLLGSTAFVLHARQARHYSPAALAIVLLLHAYLLQRRPSRWRGVYLAASSLFLLSTNDVAWLAALSAIVAHAFAVERHRIGPSVVLGALLPSMAVAVLWYLLTSTTDRYAFLDLSGFPFRLGAYALEANAHLFPLIVPFFVGVALVARADGRRRLVTLARGFRFAEALSAVRAAGYTTSLVFLISAVVAAVALLHSMSRETYLRFLIPVAPLLAAGTALLLLQPVRDNRRRLAWVVPLLLIMALSDVAGWLSDAPLRALPVGRPARRHGYWLRPNTAADLMARIQNPAQGPVAAVAELLLRRARDDDLLVAVYGDQPLRLLLPIDTYGGGGTLPPPGEALDWIWSRDGRRGGTAQYIDQNVDVSVCRTHTLTAPDRLWEYRPDPDEYWPMEQTDDPPVVVWECRGQNDTTRAR